MTRTRWMLVAQPVAASLAALEITGCGESASPSPAASGARYAGVVTCGGRPPRHCAGLSRKRTWALSALVGLLAAATPTPKGRT